MWFAHMGSSCLLVTRFDVNVVMKTIRCLLTFLFFEVNIVLGDVSISVYESDGITPFDGRNIIVGTELTLIIRSDSGDYWNGGVFLAGGNRGLGVVSARGWDPNTLDWAESRTAAAGVMATVWEYRDSWLWGCDLYTDSYGVEAGDWFILDYEAIAVGDPNFGFYDYSQSWDEPISTITLSQFPSPDFDESGIVNLADFSHFSLYWLESDCQEISWCEGADLNIDTVVDVQDLLVFSDYWLWGTSAMESQRGPEDPPLDDGGTPLSGGMDLLSGSEDFLSGGENLSVEDPSQKSGITYRIFHPQFLQEITLSLGESITLYVDKMTTGEGNISSFYVEVGISDPNLGWIDNTSYDPNDPPVLGTARILAKPNRLTEYDYWGPGSMQKENIILSGCTWNEAIYDGALASFTYTCTGIGDVILELYDRDSYNTENQKVYPQTEYIIIHQVDMNTQTTADEIEEYLLRLNELWENGETDLPDDYTEEDWNEFIEWLKDPYGSLYDIN